MPGFTGLNDISGGQLALNKMREFLNPKEPQGPLAQALKNVSNIAGLEATKYLAKLNGANITEMDSYHAIELAMKESADNQPLGILLAEKAEEQEIPFVLATSTNHHGLLTQPITDYAYKKAWTLIDCVPNTEGKASPEFWERAYNSLEKRL